MANENSLAGVKCPECGQEERFKIVARIMVDVTDEGSEPLDGNHEWDDDSICVCVMCDRTGLVKEFLTNYVAPPAVNSVPVLIQNKFLEYENALKAIANTPLYGETLTESELETAGDEIAHDEDDGVLYTPCSDTESSQLREAVEAARKILFNDINRRA